MTGEIIFLQYWCLKLFMALHQTIFLIALSWILMLMVMTPEGLIWSYTSPRCVKRLFETVYVYGGKLWNDLPEFVQNSSDIESFNSLRPRPNRRHFADDIFRCIFENENEWITPRISLKFVPEVRINNIPPLIQIMAWRRPGDKPLSEPIPMVVSLLTHICVTRPQWV